MTITLPLWLSITIGCVYLIDKIILLITSKRFIIIWNKIVLLICYKNNPRLRESRIAEKKAKQSLEATLDSKERSKRGFERQKKKLSKNKQA